MKTWNETKAAYIKDHISKTLAQPERRLNALVAIEKVFISKNPGLLEGDFLFKSFNKESIQRQYENWKGNSVSSAEKSVFTGLYKFATQ